MKHVILLLIAISRQNTIKLSLSQQFLNKLQAIAVLKTDKRPYPYLLSVNS